jgi:hypothetical protein
MARMAGWWMAGLVALSSGCGLGVHGPHTPSKPAGTPPTLLPPRVSALAGESNRCAGEGSPYAIPWSPQRGRPEIDSPQPGQAPRSPTPADDVLVLPEFRIDGKGLTARPPAGGEAEGSDEGQEFLAATAEFLPEVTEPRPTELAPRPPSVPTRPDPRSVVPAGTYAPLPPEFVPRPVRPRAGPTTTAPLVVPTPAEGRLGRPLAPVPGAPALPPTHRP